MGEHGIEWPFISVGEIREHCETIGMIDGSIAAF
jgi:hypothetical protein